MEVGTPVITKCKVPIVINGAVITYVPIGTKGIIKEVEFGTVVEFEKYCVDGIIRCIPTTVAGVYEEELDILDISKLN